MLLLSGALFSKDTHVGFKGTHSMFSSACLGVLTLFSKSQATWAIGESYLESYILEFLHLQAAPVSIDLAAISQRSKYLKVHRKVKFSIDEFESHKVMQLVGRLGTLPNGNAKT
jgi:hypothetical protein